MDFVVNGFHPFSIVVEDFVHMPQYVAPKKNALTHGMLAARTEDRFTEVKQDTFRIVQDMTVVDDCWTSHQR